MMKLFLLGLSKKIANRYGYDLLLIPASPNLLSPETDYITLLEQIKSYELYNKSEISRNINVSQSYISRLLRGKVKNRRVLEKIVHFINSKKAA